MEIHHTKVEKKNLKEYLLEGLMIFIAVSLGFFAENLRESISNNRQLHEYAESMVSDLKSDVSMYDSSVNFNLRHCAMIDSIYSGVENKNVRSGEVYFLARQLTRGSAVMSPNAKTYLQLNSTGGFRLIHRQAVADSIASYYQWMKLFDYWSELQRSRLNDVIDANGRLFDVSVFFIVYKKLEEGTNPALAVPQDNPAYMTNDPQTINDVMMHYQYYYGFLKLMDQRAALASAQAKRLIILLKNEYGITDE